MTNNKNQDQLNFKLNLKSVDDQGWFKGYASVFGVLDQHKDIIAKGAFERSLKNKRTEEIKLLWQHDEKLPIGIFSVIKEDDYGLYVEAKLLKNISTGWDAYQLLKSKAINGLSVGFIVKKSHHDKKSGHRVITDLDLWEISLVTFPANPQAQISDVKSGNQLLALMNNIKRAINALKQLSN